MTKVVDIVIEKLGDLLLEKAAFLHGVRQDVDDLKLEMECMSSFLREVETRKEIPEDDTFKTWVKQVRELAYDTEDCLDLFFSSFANGPQWCLLKGVFFLKTIKLRHRIGTHARQIKATAKMVEGLRSRYIVPTRNRDSVALLINPPLVDDSELVGVDDARNELTNLLTGGGTTSKLEVISVVGMPAVGKSALAWKIYNDPVVSNDFQRHVWIAVSQFGSIHSLLWSLILSLCEESNSETTISRESKLDQLIRTAEYQLRGMRYLVVLDGVQDGKIWEGIKMAFPDESRGSRIMITTRSDDIATSCKVSPGCSCRKYKLDQLPWHHAWTLFCRTTFHSNADLSCPQNLKEKSEEIVKMCGGLPMAIKAVGSILAKKTNQLSVEWLQLHEKLVSERSNDVFEDVLRILAASYEDLPHQLRPCFLCFGIYPKIKSARMFRIWIAEGFVSDEQEARGNLGKLIDRNMVNVIETDPLGRPKFCEVNELMHQMIVSKCNEENFSNLFNLEEQNKMTGNKIRRISINSGCLNALRNTPLYDHLRSLMVTLYPPLPRSQNKPVSKSPKPSRFRMLRVMDLEDIYIGAGSLDFESYSSPLLKYLNLRNTKALSLPKSMHKFSNLQTLDIRGTFINKLPKEIVELRRLRHLLLPIPPFVDNPPLDPLSVHWNKHSTLPGVKLPPGIKSLEELEELSLVDTDGSADNVMRELGTLNRLRKLGLRGLTEGSCDEVFSAINYNMDRLVSLALLSKGKEETILLQHLHHAPYKLERLFLAGRLGGTEWLLSLNSIVEIELVGSQLANDPLVTLQALPDLMFLSLVDAYAGTALRAGPGGFPKLETLHLSTFPKLTNVTVEATAMPKLKKLSISYCPYLQQFNLSPADLPHLKELGFHGSPPGVSVNNISQHQEVEQTQTVKSPTGDKSSLRNKEPVSSDPSMFVVQTKWKSRSLK